MSAWLCVLLIACAFGTGMLGGVHVIGGWRQYRSDIQRIDREYLAVRKALREIDEAEGR